MSTWVWIVIAAVVVVVLVAIVWSALRAKRRRQLQDTFGREYDRTVEQAGGRRAAEQELLDRKKQHEQLDIRPLSPESRERYVRRWQSTQARFVDDPTAAVAEADQLVQEVMQERGYPTKDFERRVSDISIDHPGVVEKYRTADGIARASERGEATTEDMRHSVRHYRALFAELLETDDDVENVDDVSSRDDGRVEAENVERLRWRARSSSGSSRPNRERTCPGTVPGHVPLRAVGPWADAADPRDLDVRDVSRRRVAHGRGLPVRAQVHGSEALQQLRRAAPGELRP